MLPAADKPTNVRYGVLAFCGVLSMITYLDRVCISVVAPYIKQEFELDVAGLEDITVLAERIRGSLRERISLPGWNYSVTASVGAATGSAAEVDVHELLRDADTAMYVAKTGGKDSARLFAPSMHQRAHERFRLQVDLREALER